MNPAKLFSTYVLPNLINFKYSKVYKYQIKKYEQKLAESLDKGNIYEALDIPDLKYVKDKKIEEYVIVDICRKLKIGDENNTIKIVNNVRHIFINNVAYQLIIFPINTLPKVSIKSKNLMFFMYTYEYEKVYYCGKLNNINEDSFNNDYCLSTNKIFIRFNLLIND